MTEFVDKRLLSITRLVGIIQVLVATLLLVSGLTHLAQPYFFAHSVASYRVFPSAFIPFVGLVVPGVQVSLGLMHLMQIHRRFTLGVSAAIFFAFTLLQVTVILRGMNIDCGCFGFTASPVSVATMSVPLVCCVLSCIGFALPHTDVGDSVD